VDIGLERGYLDFKILPVLLGQDIQDKSCKKGLNRPSLPCRKYIADYAAMSMTVGGQGISDT
jgi:hypothetical protein